MVRIRGARRSWPRAHSGTCQVLALLLVVFSVSCGSAQTTDPTGTASPLPFAESPTAMETPIPDFGSRQGLVLLTCGQETGSTTQWYRLELIDPRSGLTLATRRFDTYVGPLDWTAPYRGLRCSQHVPGRQAFDSQFDLMAVEIHNSSDDSIDIGVVRADGDLIDITAAQPRSDFASAPRHHDPIFMPNGELWYRDDGASAVFSVRIDATGVASKPQRIDSSQSVASYVYGWLVAEAGTITRAPIPNEDYTVGISRDSGSPPRLLVDKPGVAEHVASLQVSEDQACQADIAWVGALTFVCAVVTGSPLTSIRGQLLLGSLSPDLRAVEFKRLLPVTNRTVENPVVSPDDSELAFISGQGETAAIFRVSLQSGAEPQNVVELARPTNTGFIGWFARLLEWQRP